MTKRRPPSGLRNTLGSWDWSEIEAAEDEEAYFSGLPRKDLETRAARQHETITDMAREQIVELEERYELGFKHGRKNGFALGIAAMAIVIVIALYIIIFYMEV